MSKFAPVFKIPDTFERSQRASLLKGCRKWCSEMIIIFALTVAARCIHFQQRARVLQREQNIARNASIPFSIPIV